MKKFLCWLFGHKEKIIHILIDNNGFIVAKIYHNKWEYPKDKIELLQGTVDCKAECIRCGRKL